MGALEFFLPSAPAAVADHANGKRTNIEMQKEDDVGARLWTSAFGNYCEIIQQRKRRRILTTNEELVVLVVFLLLHLLLLLLHLLLLLLLLLLRLVTIIVIVPASSLLLLLLFLLLSVVPQDSSRSLHGFPLGSPMVPPAVLGWAEYIYMYHVFLLSCWPMRSHESASMTGVALCSGVRQTMESTLHKIVTRHQAGHVKPMT